MFALEFQFQAHMYVVCGYKQTLIDFQQCQFQNGRLVAVLKVYLCVCVEADFQQHHFQNGSFAVIFDILG